MSRQSPNWSSIRKRSLMGRYGSMSSHPVPPKGCKAFPRRKYVFSRVQKADPLSTFLKRECTKAMRRAVITLPRLRCLE